MMNSEHIGQGVPLRMEGSPSVQPAVTHGAGSMARNTRLRQNWVLNPLQDTLFIIAAPLISLGLALLAMQYYGAAEGAALVITAHVVLTVAHHMPTFIRIYGDVELFNRFRWHFLLGPVVPLLFSIAVLAYIGYHRYPVEYFLYLYIFLTLWDPWHFLRQHFGFMRIYDRHNAAPAALASNMDWAISAVWFAHIMAASADWIPGLLEDLYRTANIPLLLTLPSGFLPALQSLTWWLAALTTVAYGLYLLWCVRRGYYISLAKLALLVGTFGVMYLTYTPNEWILQLVPAWGFKVGFATLGVVHMTQYLAIVWRYDRRIAQQGRARQNWFHWFHSRTTRWGGALAAAVYVLFCIGYGDVITTAHANRWLMSCLLAIGFTSTLMHYYFDGFIWKIRHSQNREALDLHISTQDARQLVGQRVFSWWSNTKKISAGRALLRQLLYFGVPMATLTVGALSIWETGNVRYVQHMYRAQTLSQQGHADTAAQAARLAYASMQAELPFAEKMVDLKPSAANEAQLAFLVYNESLYRNRIMPALAEQNPTSSQQQSHYLQVRRAAQLLHSAVTRGGSLAHPGREQLTMEECSAIVSSWQRQIQ